MGDLELNQEKVVHLNRCRKVPGPENCLDESTLSVIQESDCDQTLLLGDEEEQQVPKQQMSNSEVIASDFGHPLLRRSTRESRPGPD